MSPQFPVIRPSLIAFLTFVLLHGCVATRDQQLSSVGVKTGQRISDRGGTFSIVPASGWSQAVAPADPDILIVLRGPTTDRGQPTMFATAFTGASGIELETHRDASITSARRAWRGYKVEHLRSRVVDGHPAVVWSASKRVGDLEIRSLHIATKVRNTIYDITFQTLTDEYRLYGTVIDEMISSIKFGSSR